MEIKLKSEKEIVTRAEETQTTNTFVVDRVIKNYTKQQVIANVLVRSKEVRLILWEGTEFEKLTGLSDADIKKRIIELI